MIDLEQERERRWLESGRTWLAANRAHPDHAALMAQWQDRLRTHQGRYEQRGYGQWVGGITVEATQPEHVKKARPKPW